MISYPWGLWGRTFGLRPVRHGFSVLSSFFFLFSLPA
jgi:hypothetical protein